MKISYKHLVKFIEENPSIKQISDSLFQLGHEHEIEDHTFNIEFTPNRGDCLSINGLLRDLRVFYTINHNKNFYREDLKELSIDFKNLSRDICPKIAFLKIQIDQIPKAYKGSLNSYFSDFGLKRNNFFTDVSNYLSYETGQPTHCYDANEIKGELVFQEIKKETHLQTLLNKEIILTNENSVFLLNNEVINLAGVIGGESTSCKTNTRTAIIECAYFQPENIIGKSLKYDVQSEASYKFERGVDPECHEKVLRRFINIVSQHTKIKDMSVAFYNFKDNPSIKIPVNVSKINQILGTHISDHEYSSYLLKLGFHIERDIIKVPSYRNDIQTQNDLAEEVARVIGYNNIQRSSISIQKYLQPKDVNTEEKLRFFLLDHGFYEVINFPFVNSGSPDAIKVDNPLDSNRKYLRTNITNSLIENLLYNERRQNDSIKLFEISDIYTNNKSIHKKRKLSLIASGKIGHNYKDFSKKIDKEYLSSIFLKVFPNTNFEFINIPRDSLDTKIKSEIISLEIDLKKISNNILDYKEIFKSPKGFIKYKPISEQPSSFKDISFSINEYSKTKDLEDLLLNYKNDLIKDVFVFDYFNNQSQNQIKIGFRFIFQSKDETLTSEKIDKILNNLVKLSLKIDGVEIPGLKI